MPADNASKDLIHRLISEFPGMAYQCAPERERTLRFASHGAFALTGRAADDLVAEGGVALRSLVEPDHRKAVDLAVQEALRVGNGYSVRYPLQRPDGRTLWVWDRGSVVERDGQSWIEGWLNDITEMVFSEMRANASQRREALGELIGGVAGVYNNVLTSVIGAIELSLDRFDPDDPVTNALEEGRAAALRGGDLTRQLLAFARQFPSTPKVTDLNALLQRTQGLFQQLLGQQVRIFYTLDPDLPPVRVDPAQMEQVVLNLVLNARDAMPNGGRIVVRSESRELTAEDLRKGDDLPVGPYAVIHVRDMGTGVEKDVRARMFEPFVTTKPHASGLGLATSYGIVQQAGGIIRVRSAPDEGSTFTVLIPALKAEATESPLGEARSRAKPLILVVDDEDSVRRTMVRALERSGFRTLEASDTPSALCRAEENAELPGLLLTDVMMPGPKGTDLADQLQERFPGLPVLFVSGRVGEAETPALRLGPDRRFLAKPFTLVELLGGVRAAMEAGGRSSQVGADLSSEGEGLADQVG